MSLNQLFLRKPPLDLFMKILNNCTIDSLNSNIYFSVNILENNNSIIKSKLLLDELSEYYLPCKKKVYFSNITNRKLITIIKQVLRLYDHKLQSTEKYSNSKKYILYQIVPKDVKVKKTRKNMHKISNERVVLKFD